MDFIIDKLSPLPPYLQIQEQIKVALLVGRLRPGDTLPSIRDLEKQIGVSRNIVRKAYLALQRSGILRLRHGKGVLVEEQLNYNQRASITEGCEILSRHVWGEVERLGVSPSAFARYLFQQARERERAHPFIVFVDATERLALERAEKISSVWQVNVPGISIEELASLDRPHLKRMQKILTNYIRLDQVRKVVKGCAVDVIPLSLVFSPSMAVELKRLPLNASLVLVLDDRDYPAMSLMLENYRKILVEPTVKLSATSMSRIRNLTQFVKAKKYDKIIFSNRIWDQVPDRLKKKPRVTHPRMDIDLASLESARIQAGMIV